MKFLFISSLILFSFVISFSQTVDIKFKLAQNYEQGGDWEHAIPLYEELYQRDSSNGFVFDALRRGYLFLKKYDNAIFNTLHFLSGHSIKHLLAAISTWYIVLLITKQNEKSSIPLSE